MTASGVTTAAAPVRVARPRRDPAAAAASRRHAAGRSRSPRSLSPPASSSAAGCCSPGGISGGGTQPDGGTRIVAVLPFENLGDSSDAYFADGVTDEVRTKLGQVAGLEVIARGSSLEYRRHHQAADRDRP